MAEFADRRDAGSRLALGLQGYAERPDVLVLAVGAGGIPVGYEIAVRLGLPLTVFARPSIEHVVPGNTIIVAVDGVETAAGIVPSLTALRACHPVELVAAIPVACADSFSTVSAYVDDIVCLVTSPRDIALAYRDFSPITHADAQQLLGFAALQWRELSLHGSHGW